MTGFLNKKNEARPQGLTPWIFTARRRPEPVPAPMPPQTPEAQVPSWWVKPPEIWRWLMATSGPGEHPNGYHTNKAGFYGNNFTLFKLHLDVPSSCIISTVR